MAQNFNITLNGTVLNESAEEFIKHKANSSKRLVKKRPPKVWNED